MSLKYEATLFPRQVQGQLASLRTDPWATVGLEEVRMNECYEWVSHNMKYSWSLFPT